MRKRVNWSMLGCIALVLLIDFVFFFVAFMLANVISGLLT